MYEKEQLGINFNLFVDEFHYFFNIGLQYGRMCYNQKGVISTLDRTSLKLVNKFTYVGSSVSSTEKDINTRLTKAWTPIDRLSIIWKSDLTDKMKRSFFQAAFVSILLYRCTTWTLTKQLKKKLDGNYTRMLRPILNKSWRLHQQVINYTATCLPSRKLYKLEEPDMQGTAGEARTKSSVMCSYGPPHIAEQRQDDQLEHTYSSYGRIRDVALKTCRKRCMIGRSSKKGSGISVLAARHDDDDDGRIYCFQCNVGWLKTSKTYWIIYSDWYVSNPRSFENMALVGRKVSWSDDSRSLEIR